MFTRIRARGPRFLVQIVYRKTPPIESSDTDERKRHEFIIIGAQKLGKKLGQHQTTQKWNRTLIEH